MDQAAQMKYLQAYWPEVKFLYSRGHPVSPISYIIMAFSPIGSFHWPNSIPARKMNGKNYANSPWRLFRIHRMMKQLYCQPNHT